MSQRTTIVELRTAIAEVLAQEKSYDLPAICISLGLDQGTAEEANSSKRTYVRSRINTKSISELVELGEKLLEQYPQSEALDALDNKIHIFKTGSKGVNGQIKNLIFAADGLKPELVLSDALDNTIEIVKNASFCLVYDLSILQIGLLWSHLVEWWSKKCNLPFPDKNTELNLYNRLKKSLDSNSPPEILLFRTYFQNFHKILGDRLPALIPQVYLHYDPKTLQELKGVKRIPRQRMDFLILFSNGERVVIEVDGKQHYSSNNTASPQKYSEMVSEDRKLKLQGYEVYRFGGYELNETHGEQLVVNFFERLFKKYKVE